jgi:hypothetical protein
MEIVFSGQYLDEASFASIVVNQSGLAAITYDEFDSYSFEAKLKVTYQKWWSFFPVTLK